MGTSRSTGGERSIHQLTCLRGSAALQVQLLGRPLGGYGRKHHLVRAVVWSEPGPAENLVVHELPMPPERDGWVRIRVEAFGLNRSELMTRLGMSGAAVTFPRVLGIECAGVVDAAPSGSGLKPGAASRGDHGRDGPDVRRQLRRIHPVPLTKVIPIRLSCRGRSSVLCRR